MPFNEVAYSAANEAFAKTLDIGPEKLQINEIKQYNLGQKCLAQMYNQNLI